MGTIYLRGSIYWIGFRGPDGKWHYKSSGFGPADKAKARAALKVLEVAVLKGERLEETGPITVRAYAKLWSERRRAHGLWNATREEASMKHHALPYLGSKFVTEVRPRDIREMLAGLRAKNLAPRTRANIYGAVHRLFADAVADELIEYTPCQVPAMELPKRRDSDGFKRSKAFYSRIEMQRLISEPRVPLCRRVVYALALLGGLREGEVGALTWSDYDSSRDPLGCLRVSGSYSRLHKQVKSTKSGAERDIPVHPALAKILATWKLSGWAAMHGRAPKANDLLIPSRSMTHLTDSSILGGLAADFKELGLPHRRFHDMRRTFVSLALADGARKDVLRWVTHGPSRDVIDLYTTLPWPALCESVSCLKVKGGRGGLTTVPTTMRRRNA